MKLLNDSDHEYLHKAMDIVEWFEKEDDPPIALLQEQYNKLCVYNTYITILAAKVGKIFRQKNVERKTKISTYTLDNAEELRSVSKAVHKAIKDTAELRMEEANYESAYDKGVRLTYAIGNVIEAMKNQIYSIRKEKQ